MAAAATAFQCFNGQSSNLYRSVDRIDYDENPVTRIMRDKSVKRAFSSLLLVQKSLKRKMMSEMTDAVPKVTAMGE